MRSTIKSKYMIWFIAALLISALFNSIVFTKYGEHYLDSDISSQLVLAQHLNKENTIISDNFYYSTEIGVANSSHIYQMIMKLFPNDWHMVRIVAVVVNMFILSFGFIYMVKAVTTDFSVMLAGLAVILLPFSSGYMFLMTFGCFYQVFTATAFFDIGVILRANIKDRKIIRTILLVLINVVISLSGLKMMMFSALPVGVVCLYFLLRAVTKIDNISELFKRTEWKMVITGIVNCISIGCGFLINNLLISPNYHVDNYVTTNLSQFSIADVLTQIQYLPEYLGFVGNIPLFSISGIASFVTIFVFLFLVLAIAILLRESIRMDFHLVGNIKGGKHNALGFKENDNEGIVSLSERFVIIFCVTSILLGILVNVSTPKGRNAGHLGVGYYMPGFLLLIICGFIFLTKLSSKKTWIIYAMVSLLYFVFLGKSVAVIRDTMQSSDSHYEQTSDWLVENGYTEGFATFWNGNVLSEASNGQIEVWVLWDLKDSKIYKWLQKTSHSSVYPKGKCFVYATSMQIWNHELDIEFMESITDNWIVLPNDDRLYLFESGNEYMSHFEQS